VWLGFKKDPHRICKSKIFFFTFLKENHDQKKHAFNAFIHFDYRFVITSGDTIQVRKNTEPLAHFSRLKVIKSTRPEK